jgi:4-carboxymuconolactone decarboxylase
VFAFRGEPKAWDESSKTSLILTTGHHPDPDKVCHQQGKHSLMNTTLNTHQLEIILLRISWRVPSACEWQNHVGHAINASQTHWDADEGSTA